MELVTVLKFIGWVFAGTPVAIFLSISIFMIYGASKDDDLIMALSLLGLTIFSIGVILLLLVYLTGLFDGGNVSTFL